MAETMLSRKEPSKKNTMEKAPEINANAVSMPSRKESVPVKKPEAGPSKIVQTGKKSTTSKTPCDRSAAVMNTEVLKILQEMNTNINKHGENLKTLSERVDTLYEYPEYTENYENYGESFDESQYEVFTPDNEEENMQPAVSQEDEEPPTNRPKTVFGGLSDKFLLSEKVDNEVNEDLASFVNSSFKNGVTDERIQEMFKDIVRPQNCDSLTKTRVNPGLWRLLKPQTQTEDSKLQTIQNCIIKASVNMVKLLDKEGENLDSQSVEWGTNSLALLGQSNKLINNKRKESHKYDFDPKYFPLSSPSLPYTDYLYGNENDINRNVKDINEMCRIGKVSRGFRGRGFRGGPYRRPGRGMRRGGPRGRGFYRPYEAAAHVAKNFKEAQRK